MTATLSELIAGWPGEAVVCRFDVPTEAWIFVALHNSALGTPVGGTRMRIYDRPEEGLLDAMRLAEGMTNKWASIALPYGGGKAVLALSRELKEEEREGLLTRYAGVLNLLGGAFETGEDLGTTPADIAFLADLSSYAMGRDAHRQVLDPGPYTATGVLVGIRAAALHALNREDLAGLDILVQGIGDVGGPLARQLAEAGARLILSDLDQERTTRFAEALGARSVEPARIWETACDIFVPCAVGAVLNAETIPRLRCTVVAGSANNQLAEEADAVRLHERGILYVPDYIINAGGALAFGLMNLGETRKEMIDARLQGLGSILRDIFKQAEAADIPPVEAAKVRVSNVLATGREALEDLFPGNRS